MKKAPRISKRCAHCNADFQVLPSRGNAKFCSHKCAGPYRGKRHGESYTRLYGIWVHINSRCRSEKDKQYGYYGARGILVCDEWRTSYEAFRDWANANGYSESLEIDRINVNGNYEPGNCRWATRLQQMGNTRKRKDGLSCRFKGVARHNMYVGWIARCNDNGKDRYLGSFKTPLSAALAYDDFAFSVRGEHSFLNFPERFRSKFLRDEPEPGGSQ